VVNKNVPDAVTVVGIPGRIVRKATTVDENRRREMAAKIGFDAYGMTDDMPDPIARSIHNLMDHMHAVDRKIDSMCRALSNLGDNTCADALPELEEETFVSLHERLDSIKDAIATNAAGVAVAEVDGQAGDQAGGEGGDLAVGKGSPRERD